MKTSNKLLWSASAAVLAVVLLAAFSFKPLFAKVKGNGQIVSETYSLNRFDTINIDGWYAVTLAPNEQPYTVLSMDENLLDHIEVAVINNQLYIGSQATMCIDPSQIAQATINYTPALRQLNLSGNIELDAKQLDSERLTINLGGKSNSYVQGDIKHLEANIGGDATLEVEVIDADTIILNVGGNGIVTLIGQVDNLFINVGGRVNITAKHLIAKNVAIKGAGLSHVSVHVTDKLDVNAMGKSVIQYYGNPKSITNNSFGDVVLKQMN